MGDFIPFPKGPYSTLDGLIVRNIFFQRLRISDDNSQFPFILGYLADSGSALHAKGGFVIAPFYPLSGRRKEEYFISFD